MTEVRKKFYITKGIKILRVLNQVKKQKIKIIKNNKYIIIKILFDQF